MAPSDTIKGSFTHALFAINRIVQIQRNVIRLFVCSLVVVSAGVLASLSKFEAQVCWTKPNGRCDCGANSIFQYLINFTFSFKTRGDEIGRYSCKNVYRHMHYCQYNYY